MKDQRQMTETVNDPNLKSMEKSKFQEGLSQKKEDIEVGGQEKEGGEMSLRKDIIIVAITRAEIVPNQALTTADIVETIVQGQKTDAQDVETTLVIASKTDQEVGLLEEEKEMEQDQEMKKELAGGTKSLLVGKKNGHL